MHISLLSMGSLSLLSMGCHCSGSTAPEKSGMSKLPQEQCLPQEGDPKIVPFIAHIHVGQPHPLQVVFFFFTALYPKSSGCSNV